MVLDWRICNIQSHLLFGKDSKLSCLTQYYSCIVSCLLHEPALTGGCTCCRAQAIAVLLKDSTRLEQERAAFASKRQVYKGFSREQLSNGVTPRTHSADSMEGFSGGTSSYSRQQVPPPIPLVLIAWQPHQVMQDRRTNNKQHQTEHSTNKHFALLLPNTMRSAYADAGNVKGGCQILKSSHVKYWLLGPHAHGGTEHRHSCVSLKYCLHAGTRWAN